MPNPMGGTSVPPRFREDLFNYLNKNDVPYRLYGQDPSQGSLPKGYPNPTEYSALQDEQELMMRLLQQILGKNATFGGMEDRLDQERRLGLDRARVGG